MNRSFLYGDGFFETININNGQIPLLDYHIQRIKESLAILKLEPSFTIDRKFLLENLKLDKNGIARITFYRSGEGKYLPLSNDVLFEVKYTNGDLDFWLPQGASLLKALQSLTPKATTLGISLVPKPIHPLFTIKTTSAALYVLYAKEMQAAKANHWFIASSSGEIIEELSANFLILKNNKLYCPMINSGQVMGVTLRYLMEKYESEITQCAMDAAFLKNAEVIYLSKGSTGVEAILPKWV